MTKHTAINPTEQNVPKMDRPSIAFAWFLDSMVIEQEGGQDPSLFMTCTLCGSVVCAVEDGDSLRVLLNTALAHDC